VALVLLLVLPVVRVMMLEILRDPFEVSPGAAAIPRGPGAASTVVLNLLCCAPALLVLLRRAIDGTYRLRLDWSHPLLALLASWTVLSAVWADDSFAAVVSGTTFFGAVALLWGAVQLVRGWGEFRLVGAVTFGLMVVLLASGMIYRFIEFPDLQRQWNMNRQQILHERGWDEGSFPARQFEKRVVGGELTGFTASPNTFGAAVVLTMLVALGLGLQRTRDDGRGWLVFVALTLGAGAWLLYYTGSRTAGLTPFLAGGLLTVAFFLRPWLVRHSILALWIGVGLFVLASGALVGHGLYHGTLFHDSLTFRWKYWVGSASVFFEHPWLGVGSYNFGQSYLAHRLPDASEEIKDPHNFIVRTFVELGAVGGLLLLAWMVRLWRELTRPILPSLASDNDINQSPSPAWRGASVGGNWGTVIPWLATVGAVALVVNAAMSVDWKQEISFVITEVLKRLLFTLALVVGAAVVSIRSMQDPELDDRPAPVALWLMLASLGVFLVHNLVDFSLYEAGPMMLFGVLAGAALGVRSRSTESDGTERSRVAPTLAFACAMLVWGAGWAMLAVPIVAAEQNAVAGDDALRASRFYEASTAYDRATDWVPYNSDYPFRSARALLFARSDAQPVLDRLSRAVSTNPSGIDAHLMRAQFNANLNNPDAAVRDYGDALRLNPNDVSMRLRYAETLAAFGKRTEAVEQVRTALKYDDLLDPAEPKRLDVAHKAKLRSLIDSLSLP